jgi:hypothetical protein
MDDDDDNTDGEDEDDDDEDDETVDEDEDVNDEDTEDEETEDEETEDEHEDTEEMTSEEYEAIMAKLRYRPPANSQVVGPVRSSSRIAPVQGMSGDIDDVPKLSSDELTDGRAHAAIYWRFRDALPHSSFEEPRQMRLDLAVKNFCYAVTHWPVGESEIVVFESCVPSWDRKYAPTGSCALSTEDIEQNLTRIAREQLPYLDRIFPHHRITVPEKPYAASSNQPRYLLFRISKRY